MANLLSFKDHLKICRFAAFFSSLDFLPFLCVAVNMPVCSVYHSTSSTYNILLGKGWKCPPVVSLTLAKGVHMFPQETHF